MAQVLVINDSGHDFSAAEEYGEIVIMTSGTVNKFSLTSMLREFQPFLDSSTSTDYLLQSGPAVMAAIACAAFAAKHGCLNLLLWKADRDAGDHYVLRKLVFK
jgi:hypothetical protein